MAFLPTRLGVLLHYDAGGGADAQLHDRQPVILASNAWHDPKTPAAEAAGLLAGNLIPALA